MRRPHSAAVGEKSGRTRYLLADGVLQLRFMQPVRIGQQMTTCGNLSTEVTDTYSVWVEDNEGVRVIDRTFTLAAGHA